MDLSSHLQESQSFDKLEEDSKLADEQHELPDLPKAKKKVNNCGVGANVCSGCIFFVSLCSAIISVSIFVVENNKTADFATNDTTTGCIMYASVDDSNQLRFDQVGLCNFIVFGTAGLGGLSLLYMYGSCCRMIFSCVMGLSTFNIIAVLDFIVMTVTTLFALAIGVMINLGRKATCKAISDANGSNCMTSKISDHHGSPYDFDKFMNVAEITAWITACVYAFMAILNMFYVITYLFKCCKDKNQTANYENELDAFNRTFAEDEDDDPLLDPSKAPNAPQLRFEGNSGGGGTTDDHASFPPYNTGSGEGGFYGDQMWNGET